MSPRRRPETTKIAARCGAGHRPAHELTIGARVENPPHICRGVVHVVSDALKRWKDAGCWMLGRGLFPASSIQHLFHRFGRRRSDMNDSFVVKNHARKYPDCGLVRN